MRRLFRGICGEKLWLWQWNCCFDRVFDSSLSALFDSWLCCYVWLSVFLPVFLVIWMCCIPLDWVRIYISMSALYSSLGFSLHFSILVTKSKEEPPHSSGQSCLLWSQLVSLLPHTSLTQICHYITVSESSALKHWAEQTESWMHRCSQNWVVQLMGWAVRIKPRNTGFMSFQSLFQQLSEPEWITSPGLQDWYDVSFSKLATSGCIFATSAHLQESKDRNVAKCNTCLHGFADAVKTPKAARKWFPPG